MPELQDLYQEIILEHSRNPRNFRVAEAANRTAEGYNPLCGDHYAVFVDVTDESIRDISFQGSGCAISKASASMMTQMLKNKTPAEAEEVFIRFHRIVTGEKGSNPESLDKLAAFAGISEFPSRVKCATLPWHTLRAALHGEQVASTE